MILKYVCFCIEAKLWSPFLCEDDSRSFFRLLLLPLLFAYQVFLVFSDNGFAASFPLFSVVETIIKILVRADSKHSTILEFLGEWDNVKVKETKFALVPSFGWVFVSSASLVGSVAFSKESFVPLAVNVPMLHCMGDV